MCTSRSETRHENGAAPVVRNCVNFVEDHRFDGCQRLAAARGRQQQQQTFGRCDQDFRRRTQHPLPLVGRRIAGAHLNTNRRNGITRSSEFRAQRVRAVGRGYAGRRY
jgi:hypothetical protein